MKRRNARILVRKARAFILSEMMIPEEMLVYCRLLAPAPKVQAVQK